MDAPWSGPSLTARIPPSRTRSLFALLTSAARGRPKREAATRPQSSLNLLAFTANPSRRGSPSSRPNGERANGSRVAALLRTLAGSDRNAQSTAAPVHSLRDAPLPPAGARLNHVPKRSTELHACGASAHAAWRSRQSRSRRMASRQTAGSISTVSGVSPSASGMTSGPPTGPAGASASSR